MDAPTHEYWPRRCKGFKKDCQASYQAELLQCRSQGDQLPGIDDPGHATRLVAMQQPDKAQDFAISSSDHCVAAKEFKHSMTNRARLEHVTLPHVLAHGVVRTKSLPALFPHMSQRRAF